MPGDDLAANLLGFTGRDWSAWTGWRPATTTLLRGATASGSTRSATAGPRHAEIPGGYSRRRGPAGQLPELTIDRDLQFEVQQHPQREMTQAEGATGAPWCSTCAPARCSPRPATRPTTRRTRQRSDPADRDDAATSFMVDPGSVHKAITFGAGLEEGAVTPTRPCSVVPRDPQGRHDLHATPIPPERHADDPAGHPGVLVERRHDHGRRPARRRQKLYDYQRRSGWARRPGSGCPARRPGCCCRRTTGAARATARSRSGTASSVTPLQMAAVYAAIANDGV